MNELRAKAKELSIKIGSNSQMHGTIFERYIKKIFNLEHTGDSTSTFDAYTKEGTKFLDEYPIGTAISIKTTKKSTRKTSKTGEIKESGDIMAANFFAQANEVNEDFVLIIGEWDEFTFNIVSIKIYFIKVSIWKTFFNRQLVDKYEFFLSKSLYASNNVEHEKLYWDGHNAKFKEVWEKHTPNVIRPRPKNDCKSLPDGTKKNKNRIQCAINRQGLIDYFGETEEIYKVTNPDVYYKFAIADYHNQKEKERLREEQEKAQREVEKARRKLERKKKKGETPFEKALRIAERHKQEMLRDIAKGSLLE